MRVMFGVRIGVLCGAILASGCGEGPEDCAFSGGGCSSPDPISFESDDGGEIRAENLIYPDGTSRTLVTAHFFDAQNGKMTFPAVSTAPEAFVACNWVGGSGGEGSPENPAPEEIYPFGDASDELGVTASFAPGGRHYLDVGETMTLQAEGRDAIELQRYEDHLTPFVGGSFHTIAYGPAPSSDATTAISADLLGGDGDLSDGIQLEVTLSGGADVDRTEWTFDGTFAGIEIPPRPVILASHGNAIDWSQAGAPLASQDIVRGEELEITYDVPADVHPDLLSMVTIYQTEPTFEITHICLNTHPGQARLSGSLHEQMAPQGMMVVSNFYHRLRSIDGERRVDLVGVASTSSYYNLVD